MQIRQRVDGKNIAIDAGTMSVLADGRPLLEMHSKRIVDEAKKNDSPLAKMIVFLSKKEIERKN